MAVRDFTQVSAAGVLSVTTEEEPARDETFVEGTGQGTLTVIEGGGSAPFVDRPYPTYTEYRLAALYQKSLLLNNGSSGYNNVTDTASSGNPYGAASVALTAMPSNTDQFYIPASALAQGIDVSTGSWNVGFRYRPVSNAGAEQAVAGRFSRFNIELYSVSTPGTLGSNYHQLQAGAGADALLEKYSTAADHSTPGRWQTVTVPLSFFAVAGTGADLTSLKLARVQVRALTGNICGIELGEVYFTQNPKTKGQVIFGQDDLFDNGMDMLALGQTYGCPVTLWPGAFTALVNQSGKLTDAQINTIVAAGGQLAGQAVLTETYATLAAETQAKRLSDIDAMFTYQKANYPANLDGHRFGSHFSDFPAYKLGAVYDDYVSRFHSMRRFDGGNGVGPPLPWGETFPEGDRYNIRALDITSVSEAQVLVALDFCATHKGVLHLVCHGTLTNVEAAMAYVQSHPSTLEATTPMRMHYGT